MYNVMRVCNYYILNYYILSGYLGLVIKGIKNPRKVVTV